MRFISFSLKFNRGMMTKMEKEKQERRNQGCGVVESDEEAGQNRFNIQDEAIETSLAAVTTLLRGAQKPSTC